MSNSSSNTTNSLFGFDWVLSNTLAEAHAEELQNPEGKEHLAVLLVRPVVIGVLNAVGWVVAGTLVHGAKSAEFAETSDSCGDPDAEVGNADHVGHGAGTESEGGLAGTDGGTTQVEGDDGQDEAVGEVHVGPVASFAGTVLVAVVAKVGEDVEGILGIVAEVLTEGLDSTALVSIFDILELPVGQTVESVEVAGLEQVVSVGTRALIIVVADIVVVLGVVVLSNLLHLGSRAEPRPVEASEDDGDNHRDGRGDNDHVPFAFALGGHDLLDLLHVFRIPAHHHLLHRLVFFFLI